MLKQLLEGKTLSEVLSESSMSIAIKDAPNWVKKILKNMKMRKDIEVTVGVDHSIPGTWHDNNLVTLYFYKNGKVQEQEGSYGGQNPYTSREKNIVNKGFKIKLSSLDEMLLRTNTYPKTATLYVHPDAMVKMLPEPATDLTALEKAVLFVTRSLKSFARKEEADSYGISGRDYDSAKKSLIEKGLLKKNGSITPNGKNAISDVKNLRQLGFKHAYLD